MRRGKTPRLIASFAVTALAAATAAAAMGETTRTAEHAATQAAKRVVVSTQKLPKLGTVVVDGKGRTLYMFVPDKRKKVTCVGTCAAVWPPLKVSAHEKIVARGAAKAKLLGSDRDPAGGRVVTYHGWPLYYYVGDKRAGQATGQALNLNGGLWYVLAPSGKVIKRKA